MTATDLRRTVGAAFTLETPGDTRYALAVNCAPGVPLAREVLDVRLDGDPVAVDEVVDASGTRLQLFTTGRGRLEVRYDAEVVGRAAPAPVSRLDREIYVRPSRYVQSDALQPFARDTFGDLRGLALVQAVDAWVHTHLAYTAAATSPTGGAVETLDARAGVCRDFAHLTAALLRGLDVPARLVGVYAPQLVPMDFHAVVETVVDDAWIVVDSTHLAPRTGLVRKSIGRDAADTAWLSNTESDVQLLTLRVEATSGTAFTDDHVARVEIS